MRQDQVAPVPPDETCPGLNTPCGQLLAPGDSVCTEHRQELDTEHEIDQAVHCIDAGIRT